MSLVKTLEQALALKQADYLEFKDTGVSEHSVVSVDMNALAVTNPGSILSVPHTDGFSTCLCLAVENLKNHTIAVAHLDVHRGEALDQMIEMVRRSPQDPLRVHMVGAFIDYEGCDMQHERKEWNKEMQGLINIINSHPNVELATFDVGEKPHPVSVAFCRDDKGQTRLVRGSVDFTSTYEMEHPTLQQIRTYLGVFDHLEAPVVPEHFKPSIEQPFFVTWDGRLPEHQAELPAGKRRAKKPDTPPSVV